MSSVSISNITTGMTLGTAFTAYGRFDTQTAFFTTLTMVQCSIEVGGVTTAGKVTESYDSTGLAGYWQADFAGVPVGTRGVLTAHLNAPVPADDQATDLTISDTPGTGGSTLTIELPPPPPPPPPPPKEDPKGEPKKKSPDPGDGAVVAAAAKKLKTRFTIGGSYTPGPLDIVLVSIRKGGQARGESKTHRLKPGTKRWDDDVQANAGELGTGYSIIAELQHNAKRIATASIQDVQIEL